jgi:hypothetical protein
MEFKKLAAIFQPYLVGHFTLEISSEHCAVTADQAKQLSVTQ